MKETKIQKYLALGLKLLPSGRINEHHWVKYTVGTSSCKDATWVKTSKKGQKVEGYHSCCGSKRSYRHNAACERMMDLVSDDYSDLKDI